MFGLDSDASRRVLLTGLAVVMLALCFGCSNEQKENGAENTTISVTDDTGKNTTVAPTDALTSTQTRPETQTTTAITENPEDTSDGIFYRSETAGFSLIFPESWKNAYVVVEWGDSSEVFERENYLNNGRGLLFTVRVMPSNEYRDDRFPDARRLGEQGGKTAVFLVPTDVAYASENPALSESYQKLAADLDAVAESFAFS